MISTLHGTLHKRNDFDSHILTGERELVIYLPPGYEQRPSQRYPVMYFHDSQNVFEPHTAFIPGQYWQVPETADRLITEQRVEPLILVGIPHGGTRRIDEFTPSPNPQEHYGGQAASYGRMLVEEVIPFIDRDYRTLPGPKHTGLGGSSLGGLVTIYLGIRYPEVFGRLAVMSPSVWWDYRMILRKIVSITHKHRAKLWLDVGLREGNNPKAVLRDVRLLRDVLMHKGWKAGSNLFYYEDHEGGHDERAWAARVPSMLQFLFPGARPRIELPDSASFR
ncbi:alpha/beta hydrolase [Bryobacter aggregatus]|uniref:alpha/beta hydrolase n=1 Tax=Bryobacter aggregatus TaxID=360054 RepID=UPI00068D8DF7|nr:alpha/beta hydrolase-fold protein [Bryobacter aggregatus]